MIAFDDRDATDEISVFHKHLTQTHAEYHSGRRSVGPIHISPDDGRITGGLAQCLLIAPVLIN